MSSQEYEERFRDIVERFVLPMQDRVYPAGTVLKGFQEVVWKDGDSYLRKLGTCSVRVVVKNTRLELYRPYDIRVIGNKGYRLIAGEVADD